MDDSEDRVRTWRQETEATLAFSPEELDELEDHLRLSFESKLERGIAIDLAWNESMADLGTSSLLALEFAKEKLMPALGRLVYSWWKPALLCVLFSIVTVAWSDQGWGRIAFWSALGLGVIASVLFLPNRAGKNAIITGVGLAICLIPLLYNFCYSAQMERIIGPGWQGMGATFSPLITVLSLAGLAVIVVWQRIQRPALEATDAPGILEWLILLLAVGPIFCEVMGDLSLRELYALPTATQLALTGDARTQYQLFKFVAVLANAMIFLTNWVPSILGALALLFSLPLVCSLRITTAAPRVFPGCRDFPWLMLLLSSACFLPSGLAISEAFRNQIDSMEVNYPGALAHGDGGGLWCPLVIIAACFGLSAVKLSQSLRHATGVRPYYATLIVVVEILTVIGTAMNITYSVAGLPLALASLIVLDLALRQGKWISGKRLAGRLETSVSKADGTELVRQGLKFGVIIAGAGSAFFALAIVMAYDSVIYIKALIEWGNSINEPSLHIFHPGDYFTAQAVEFWVVCGPVYLAACLVAGLGLVMIWTALEFIRFNTYRLLRMRKLRENRLLAIND